MSGLSHINPPKKKKAITADARTEGMLDSFFDNCAVCKLRRESNLPCYDCIYYNKCLSNKRDIVEKLNATLKGYAKRNPPDGKVFN